MHLAGYDAGHSKQAPFPFTNEVTVDVIAAAGNKLWKQLVGTDIVMKVTNVSLAFAGLEAAEMGQKTITGFLKRRGEDDEPPHPNAGADRQEVAPADLDDDPFNDSNTDSLSFTCARCGKRISAPSHPTSAMEKETQLAVLKVEHDDYHFAQDLAKDTDNIIPVSAPSSKGPPKRKKQKVSEAKPVGIEKFFQPKFKGP